MDKRLRNALIAVGTVSASVVGIGIALTRLTVDLAVKRDVRVQVPEKFQDKISGGLKTDPRVKKIEEASETAKQYETETVQIEVEDGLKLTGHIRECASPRRIIIAMHGWRSSWSMDFGVTADFYHDNGAIMLYADQRGQNDSDGEYIGFGILERYDCIKWLEFVRERYGDELPIYLLGVSMGASTVLMASGAELPDSVKGIIADCGFTSPKEIWNHILDNNLHLNGKLMFPLVNSVCKRVAQFDSDCYSTVDALSVNTKPVLFIHGSDDNFVPLKMTFENYLACNADKELLIVPGAGHGMSYITDPKAYEKAVADFFEKCEGKGFEA